MLGTMGGASPATHAFILINRAFQKPINNRRNMTAFDADLTAHAKVPVNHVNHP